jgi:hypothetical protein
MEMRLYLIVDLKFLFTMMGQDGYSAAWCIYCVLKENKWTTMHGNNDEVNRNCEVRLWTMEKLHVLAMTQMQKDALDRTCKSSGVQETPYWNFIQVAGAIALILHLHLGLRNDILDVFWECWVDVHAENQTPEQVKARKTTMLAVN